MAPLPHQTPTALRLQHLQGQTAPASQLSKSMLVLEVLLLLSAVSREGAWEKHKERTRKEMRGGGPTGKHARRRGHRENTNYREASNNGASCINNGRRRQGACALPVNPPFNRFWVTPLALPIIGACSLCCAYPRTLMG